MADNFELVGIQIEEAVIGGCLLDSDKVMPALIKAGCNKDWFNDKELSEVWSALSAMYAERKIIDVITVLPLVSATSSMLNHCMDTCITVHHMGRYIELLEDQYKKREAKTLMLDSIKDLAGTKTADEVISYAKLELSNISRSLQSDLTPTEVTDRVIADHKLAQQARCVGLRSRWLGLQAKTGGYRKSKEYIVAARPKKGKSTMMLNEAAFTAKSGVPVGIRSIEMTEGECRAKIICDEANLDLFKLDSGMATQAELDLFAATADVVNKWPLYINDKPTTIEQLCSWIREEKLDHGVEMICIDYLQIILPSQNQAFKNRNNEVAYQSNMITNSIKETDVVGLVLSQLSRAGADGKPELHHLRDSGSIEQDAYAVIFLYENDAESPYNLDIPFTFDLAAHRGGPTGRVNMIFEQSRHKFVMGSPTL